MVVCEGATEEQCIEDLRKKYRLPSVRVVVVGEAGEPHSVVKTAREEAGANKKDHPEVWVAFDRDDHDHWTGALQSARARGYGLAVSNPCIELWGLLLHEDQTAWISRADAQSRLKEIHPGYDHARNAYFDRTFILAHTEDARLRAELLLKRAEDSDDLFGNPTTRFHLLVARIVEVGLRWAEVNGWPDPRR